MTEKSKDGRKQAEAQLEAAFHDMLAKWSQTLPTEFTLGTLGNGYATGRKHYPDLHFKRDEKVPGLYYADIDLKALNGNRNGGKPEVDHGKLEK